MQSAVEKTRVSPDRHRRRTSRQLPNTTDAMAFSGVSRPGAVYTVVPLGTLAYMPGILH